MFSKNSTKKLKAVGEILIKGCVAALDKAHDPEIK
jgi:hypothetical protein